jgi:PAS domain S-box-containing protein
MGDFSSLSQSGTSPLLQGDKVLQKHADSIRLFLENIQEYAIFLLDREGRVATWNAGAEKIKGYRAEEIIGKHFSCFYLEEDKASGRPESALREALIKGQAQDEGWRLRKGGGKFWAKVTLNRLLDENGRLLGFSKVTRDRTDRRRIEMALHDKNVEMQRAIQAKDQFLANMSHELRTPLNGIIGFAEFLADEKPGALNAKQKEYLEDILHSGKHLLHVINDVLDLAKVDAGKMELRPQRFSLRKAIDDVLAAVEMAAAKKRLKIDIYVASDLQEVTLDQKRFKQVLYNLFSNAVKFTDEDGQARVVATRTDPDQFRLIVSDTGIGIRPQNLCRLFKEFEQIDPDRRRDQGTGLGLALTKKIVQLHGGNIEVQSEFGNGTTFTVTLPLSLPPADFESFD